MSVHGPEGEQRREDAYRCPAGERLPYRHTSEEDGKMLRRY
jgi:hypothetical protein